MKKKERKKERGEGSTQPAAVKGAVKITPVQHTSPFVDCLCFQKESKGFEQEKLSFVSVSKNRLVLTQRGEIYVFSVPFVTSLALYI